MSTVKTSQEIHDGIKARFEGRIGDSIQDDSAIDLFTGALSEEFRRIYQEIEDNKTPHVWTALQGDTLDKAGVGMNLPRETGESDSSYMYRILSWIAIAEASNDSAINAALLNPQKASNFDYVPYSNGCGTSTVYVIPKEYTEKSISDALEEASSIMARVASPSLYVQYIVPEIRAVRLQIVMETDGGDISLIRSAIETDVKEYINTIPPHEYLEVGEINKIGVNTPKVSYFSVIGVIINGNMMVDASYLQEVDTKFLFDDIIWEEV